MTLVDLLIEGDAHSEAFYRAVDAAEHVDVVAATALATHPQPEVRRAVALTLPLLTYGDPPSAEMVSAMITLCTDQDIRVRDYACMALGEQWRELDTPELREALAARLDDIDREVRCEALVGLANRHDARALPRVRAALSRPSGDLWWLELVAAGALSDPTLHSLVLQHQDGWDDDEGSDRVGIAGAIGRLTDPDGPGQDVIDGVAELYRNRAHGRPDGDGLSAWRLMDTMLDIAPHRARGFLWAVLARLDGDEAAIDEIMNRSALARTDLYS